MTSLATRQRGWLLAVGAIAVSAIMLVTTTGTASADLSITSIVPDEGPLAGGTEVTINGSEFPADADIHVYFGDNEAELVSVNVARTIVKVIAPAGEEVGAVNVVIENDANASDDDTEVGGFTYLNNPPELYGIAPDTAPAATTVRIFGSNIDNGATVKFGSTAATVSDWVNEHELEVTVPTGTGTVDVTVTNEDDQEAVLEDGFTYGTASGGALGTIVTGHIPAAGGFGLIVFGGTNAQLLAASGCPMATATFYATNSSGGFVTYIPGSGVAAVNAAWNALFPSGIPAMTALIGKCV